MVNNNDFLFISNQGICDGAAALVLASEEACKTHNLKPLARVVSYGIAGVDPSIMGIGPSPAIKIALERAKLSLNDMALVEVRTVDLRVTRSNSIIRMKQ